MVTDLPCHPGDDTLKGLCVCPYAHPVLAAVLTPVGWALPTAVKVWVWGEPCWAKPVGYTPEGN
jgi:hypothetical protein